MYEVYEDNVPRNDQPSTKPVDEGEAENDEDKKCKVDGRSCNSRGKG